MRLRYAPSPTGHLHIGNARTALFNYLYTKHNNGEFIVRIEDTDTARNIPGGEQSQLDNLKWLGIEWDESIDVGGPYGPYNQLARCEENIYKKYVDILLEKKLAYKCYCTSAELDQEAEIQKAKGIIPKYSGKCRNLTDEQVAAFEAEGRDFTIRFKVDTNESYSWNDIVKGDVTFNAADVSGDFNIIKRDSIPTYNFCVVIDDHLMKISHVLRGEDHISNTPKQIMIYQALGFEVPEFGHMTLIVNEAGKKLSKRDTSIVQFIEEYKNLGYLPQALFNFMSLLGWSPNSTQEIFTKDELIAEFDEKRLSKSSAKFDVNKLSWINAQYIKQMSSEDYLDFVMPFFDNKQVANAEAIALLFKDQLSFGAQINELTTLFTSTDFQIDAEAIEFIKQDGIINTLEVLKNVLAEAQDMSPVAIKALIKEVSTLSQAKGKMLFMPLRIATTGQMHGPELTDAISILGKERCIANIELAIKEINA